jgi:predicted histidine transporter YuiF (NhaC family)
MDDKIMRVVFTFFLGALIALFVGFGIHTFYPPPERPDTGGIEMKANPTDEEVARVAAAEAAYEVKFQAYSRNVSVASMCGAVLLLGASLLLERRNKVMANGVLLGGLFTLVYGVGRGFVSRDTTTLFVTLAVALLIVWYLGFRRFRSRPGLPGEPPSTPAPSSSEQ